MVCRALVQRPADLLALLQTVVDDDGVPTPQLEAAAVAGIVARGSAHACRSFPYPRHVPAFAALGAEGVTASSEAARCVNQHELPTSTAVTHARSYSQQRRHLQGSRGWNRKGQPASSVACLTGSYWEQRAGCSVATDTVRCRFDGGACYRWTSLWLQAS